ncbi:hypothetical protein BHE74_00004732 [Ensete ventricosum]|nr:hypothetical protein BHE74_00004732 [Ensete ventricosum]
MARFPSRRSAVKGGLSLPLSLSLSLSLSALGGFVFVGSGPSDRDRADMAEDEEFARAVEDGLKLAKRVYPGKDRQLAAPPVPAAGMERTPESLLPGAPMVYAVISDPAIVDNPDIPSYQPHVHGRCNQPALIPLQMGEIGLEVDCLLDTAFVAVRGRWRVHCVMRHKSCDCRLVVPVGEQVRRFGLA